MTKAFSPFLYYESEYLKIQNYDQLVSIDQSDVMVHFSVRDGIAKSLPKSPQGGIGISKKCDARALQNHLEVIERQLKGLGVHQIQIVQPPFYYENIVSTDFLFQTGFEKAKTEVNLYVRLNEEIQLHPMQLRKLKKSRFEIRKVNRDEIGKIHHFISQCRMEQGLTINIELNKLSELFRSFPDRYEAFVAEENGRVASAVIMARPTDKIAYYYLPATAQRYKQTSPMVALLYHLYAYYRNLGFQTMDLGISSIDGKVQQGLATFKERMGAQSTPRFLLEKSLS